MQNRTKGIVCIIFAALSFALMGNFVHLAGNVPSMQKAFFRNAVAFVCSLVIMLWKHEPFHPPKPSHWGYLFARACFGTLGLLCNFYAVDRLNLSDASMLNKMSPFFAIIMSYFLLKERLTLFQGVSVAVAFLGSLLIIKPNPSNMALVPSLIGLLGGFGAGVAYSFVRVMSKKGSPFRTDYLCVLRLLLPGVSALLPGGARTYDPGTAGVSPAGGGVWLYRSVLRHRGLSLRSRQGNLGLRLHPGDFFRPAGLGVFCPGSGSLEPFGLSDYLRHRGFYVLLPKTPGRNPTKSVIIPS